MVSLSIQGVEVPIKIDSSIELEFLNGIFDDDYIPGDKTYPFDIPASPEVDALFNNARNFQIKRKVLIYKEVLLRIGGNGFYLGSLKITDGKSHRKGFYKAQFILNGFTGEDLDKSLKEVDYGNDIVLASDYVPDDILIALGTNATKTYPETVYCLPATQNDEFYPEGDSLPKEFNLWDFVNGDRYHKNFLNFAEADYKNETGYLPCMFLKHIVKSAVAEFGYKAAGHYIDDPSTDKIYLQGNYDNSYRKAVMGVFRVEEQDEYFERPDEISPYKTGVDYDTDLTPPDGGGSAFLNSDGSFSVPYDSLWRVNVSLTVEGIGTGEPASSYRVQCYRSDLYLVFEEFLVDGTAPNTYTINKTFFLNSTSFTGSIYRIYAFYDGGEIVASTFHILESTITISDTQQPGVLWPEKEIKLVNLVPDMSIRDFLREFRKAYGIKVDFDMRNKRVNFNYLRKIVEDPKPKDLTRFIVNEYLVKFEYKGKKLIYDFDGDGHFKDEVYTPEKVTALYSNYIGQFNSIAGTSISDIDELYLLNNTQSYSLSIFNLAGNSELQHLIDVYPPVVVGESPEELKIKFSPLFMRLDFAGVDEGPRPYLRASIKQPGNSPVVDKYNNKHALRVGFYDGLKPSAPGADFYPYGFVTNYGVYGSTPLLGFGDTTEDRYQRFFEAYFKLMVNAERYDFEVLMPLDELLVFQTSKKIIIRGVEFIVARFNVPIRRNGIGVGKMECYKVR